MTVKVGFSTSTVTLCDTTDVRKDYGVNGRYNAMSAGCTAQAGGTLWAVFFWDANGIPVVRAFVDDLNVSVSAGDYIYVQLRLYF
jgi:hypothetical protein